MLEKDRKDTEKILKILTQKWLEQKTIERVCCLSKCPVCVIEKSRIVKEQEAKGVLINLGIKTPLSKIPLLNVLFSM